LAGTFRWSEDPSIAWLVPSTAEDPALVKTGFFRQVRELKIQRKNPGSTLRQWGKEKHQMNFDLIIMAHYVNCNCNK
jgi:hypothetical protein